jgi:hypothetical protein
LEENWTDNGLQEKDPKIAKVIFHEIRVGLYWWVTHFIELRYTFHMRGVDLATLELLVKLVPIFKGTHFILTWLLEGILLYAALLDDQRIHLADFFQ